MEATTTSDLQQRLAAATEALQRSEERATAGQLALEVMHEVRNPIEALGHLTYLASKDAHNAEEVQRYMRLADEQLSTLSHIAGFTLGLAKSSADAKPVDLVAVAEAALRIHQRTIETRKIYLVKRFPPELPATVHAGEMLQVMSNLIVNALEALPEEGNLHLRLRKQHGSIRIVVADDGCGIPKDCLSRVFEPFFTTKGDRGTGLGLSLTKNIVERHRGTIGVRSRTNPGRSGTAFLVSLPA
jgi:signal transduction histidine kinase